MKIYTLIEKDDEDILSVRNFTDGNKALECLREDAKGNGCSEIKRDICNNTFYAYAYCYCIRMYETEITN